MKIFNISKKIAKFLLPPPIRFSIQKGINEKKCISEIRKLNIQPSSKKRIFIFDVPSHGNLGDQAITVAETEFLKNRYKSTLIYDITRSETMYAMNYIKPLINNRDILVLHGGGNMGTLWSGDKIRYKILEKFPNNKIIIFPQSIYFENTKRGNEELKVSQKKYSMHKNIHMIAREKYSYDLMKEYYPKCNVYLTPDIVLYLDKQEPHFERKGILLCFRGDKEKIVSQKAVTNIEKLLYNKSDDVKYTDTVLHGILPVSRSQRNKYVNDKLNEFKRARLVVTDRLHGMVFAAIAATPCIVLPNSYHKVKGLYAWINNLNYIKFCEKYEDVSNCIDELWSVENPYYDNRNFADNFKIICDIIDMKMSNNYSPPPRSQILVIKATS